jgi:hypothetical protein
MTDEQTDDLNGFPKYLPDFETYHPIPFFSGTVFYDDETD